MARTDQSRGHDNYRDLSPMDSNGEADVNAFVGRGVEFKGTIIYHGTIRIDGTMEGEIQTEGCLLVGDGAVLKAKVSAGVVICKGSMTGDIVAKEKVQLQSPAVLNGSVDTPMLSMEEGVLFNGRVDMAPADQVGELSAQGRSAARDRRFGTDSSGQGSQKPGSRQGQTEGAPFVGVQEN